MAAIPCLCMATTMVSPRLLPGSMQMVAADGLAVATPILRHGASSLNTPGIGSMSLGRATAQLPALAVTGGGDGIGGDEHRRYFPPVLPSALRLPISVSRRRCLVTLAGLLAAVSFAGVSPSARAAVLEADDDLELLEKVKKDRKKRLERQGVISSSGRETGYLQELVYKLSKVGQAIDNNDLSAAGTILGLDVNADWVQNVNAAFAKLSSSAEEKIEVDTFNTSLVSLISSVARKDVESSKLAFVTSASALEKWVTLTGLVGELAGL